MAKLDDLNPSLTQGTHGLHDFQFDCPDCGKPYRIGIRVKLNGASENGVWGMAVNSNMPAWGNVTVSPSISNSNHGRKKSCTFHKTIINGELV